MSLSCGKKTLHWKALGPMPGLQLGPILLWNGAARDKTWTNIINIIRRPNSSDWPGQLLPRGWVKTSTFPAPLFDVRADRKMLSAGKDPAPAVSPGMVPGYTVSSIHVRTITPRAARGRASECWGLRQMLWGDAADGYKRFRGRSLCLLSGVFQPGTRAGWLTG